MHMRSHSIHRCITALGQLVFLKRQLCDWRDLDALSARLRARVAEGASRHRAFRVSVRARRCRRATSLRAALLPRESKPASRRCAGSSNFRVAGSTHADRLRIGFVSNGFGNHPTGLLIVALIEALRDERIDAILFSTSR